MEENTLDDEFWDAIKEIVGNEYPNTPGVEGAESSPNPTSFTYNIPSTSTDGEEVSVNNRIDENAQFPAMNPQVMTENFFFPQNITQYSFSSSEGKSEDQVAYLKAMLQDCVESPSYQNAVLPDQSSFEDDEDEEESIKLVEGLMMDFQLPIECKVKEEDIEEVSNEVVIDYPKVEPEYSNHPQFPTDEDLMNLKTPDLNKALKGVPKEIRSQVKQRRRLLKNRGYARACRSRRMCSQQQYYEENEKLKQLLEQVTAERDMYKAKYENLKMFIRKAKLKREKEKEDIGGNVFC